MKYVHMILWSPVLVAQYCGLKLRTVAAWMTAARAQRRATLVASTTKKIGRYEDHISGR